MIIPWVQHVVEDCAKHVQSHTGGAAAHLARWCCAVMYGHCIVRGFTFSLPGVFVISCAGSFQPCLVLMDSEVFIGNPCVRALDRP